MTSNGIEFKNGAFVGYDAATTWSKDEKNTAILKINGKDVYVSGVTVSGVAEGTEGYTATITTTAKSSIQYKDGELTYIASGKAGVGITENTKLMNIVDASKEINLMMKVTDEISLMTSNGIEFKNGAFVGYDAEKTWSVPEKNTAVITSKDGTSIYVTGIKATKNETGNIPYKLEVAANASVQVTIEQDGYTYMYTGTATEGVTLDNITQYSTTKMIIDTLRMMDARVIATKTIGNVQVMTSFAGWNGTGADKVAKELGVSFASDGSMIVDGIADFSEASKNNATIRQIFVVNGVEQEAIFNIVGVNVWDKQKNTFSGTISTIPTSTLYTYWNTKSNSFAKETSGDTVTIYLDATSFSIQADSSSSELKFSVNSDILNDLVENNGSVRTIFGLAKMDNIQGNSNASVIYSNGSWICQNGAAFTLTEELTADKIVEFTEAQGLTIATNISEFDLGKLKGQQLTYIPGDAETALGYILSLQDENTKKAGINLTVAGDKGYTTSSGVLLATGSDFNLSLNSKNAIILRAGHFDQDKDAFVLDSEHLCSGSYTLSDNWTATGFENDKTFSVNFEAGEYITAATLLFKAGITELVGNNITWRGKEYSGLRLTIEENQLLSGETSYDDYGGQYYFELQAKVNDDNTTEKVEAMGFMYNDDGEMIGYELESTGLTSEYNGVEFTILAGAKVNISESGISIYDALVYAEGMVIGTKQSQQPENSGSGTGGATDPDSETPGLDSEIPSVFLGTFIGEQQEDGSFIGTATGLFDHYSDDTIDQVFSMATIFNVGSELSRDSMINGQSVGYDKIITGTTDNGLPVFELASTSEQARYVRENTNYEGLVTDLNNNNLIMSSGIELVVVEDNNGIPTGIQINGEGKVYTAEDIAQGAFEDALIAEIDAANPQRTSGIPVDMSDHESEAYQTGRRALQLMYSDYTGERRIGYHWEEYTYRVWGFLWEETSTRTVQEYANEDHLSGRTSTSSYMIDIYSDENVYYAYVMYEDALARCDGDQTAAEALLKEQWKFAGDVWLRADESFIMTGKDAYFIDRLYQAEVAPDRGFGIEGYKKSSSDDCVRVANILNGYNSDSLVWSFRNNFSSFSSSKDWFVRNIDGYVDSYGGDTVIYLISRAKDGSGLVWSNFAEYLQYRYKSKDGSTAFDLEAMMNHFYGGDANSYQIDELSCVLENAEWICDWYTNYARDGLFYKSSDLVAGVNMSGLTELNGLLSDAIENAIDNNFGAGWTMDAQGTIFDGTLALYISPVEGIPSGVYSLGIRNDGAYTVVDKTIENCYGIRVDFEENGVHFDVDFMLSVTYNSSGLATLDNVNPNYIVLADNVGSVRNAGAVDVPEMFKNLSSTGAATSDATETSKYSFGNIVKQLGIDLDTGDIIASGKGTRIQVNLSGVENIGDLDFGNSNQFVILNKGAQIYGMNWTGTVPVDYVFQKGYLTYDGTKFNASSDFSATFATTESLRNYGTIVTSVLGKDLSFIGIVDDTGLLSDTKLQKLIENKSFSCSPFDYESVMIDTGIGFRIEADKGDEILDLTSGGMAYLYADADFTFDFKMVKVEGTGGYAPSYTLVSINDNNSGKVGVTARLNDGYHTTGGSQTITYRFGVGDTFGLGNIMYHTGTMCVADHVTMNFLGTNHTFDNLVFGADQFGYLTLTNNINFAGGITTSQGMTVLNILQGSYINFANTGNGYQLEVLKGMSNLADANIKIDPVNGVGGASNSQIPTSVYKDGKIIEVDTANGIYKYEGGTVFNWTSNTASQDFNTSIFTRQGTEYNVGAKFNGKDVIKETQINEKGTIDFGALSHTTAEYVGGILAAVAVVVVSVVAAVCTLGASLAVEASLLATIAIGAAAGVAAAIFVAPAAFEHGAGIASCFETGNFDDFGSNLLGLAVDIFSAYMIGSTIGKIGADIIVNKGVKNLLKDVAIKRLMRNTIIGAGGGAALGVTVNGFINRANGRDFFDNWGKAFAIGLLSGGLIGFSSYLGFKAVGDKITAKLFVNTILDSIILIKTSQSFVENISIGNYRAAASDLLILISVGVINPIMQYNNAVKAKEAGVTSSKLDAETLYARGKGNVTAGLVGGTRLTNALFTGLSVGIAIPLMNVMGTIAQNFMNGDELLKGIDLKGLAVQFAIGFAAGFSIGYLNPRLGYNWSVRNIWGTIGEVIYNPASVIMKGVSSGVSLMRFNILSPILNAIISPLTGWVNNLINSSNDSYQPFKYTNEDGKFDFSAILDSWGSQFASLGEKYDRMLFGDVHDKEGWGAVKNSFGTGFFQSHFFGMAMPGAAIFKNVSYDKAGILNKIVTIWGEGGLTALPGLLPGIGNGWLSISSGEFASMITKPINMLQYTVAEKLFGGLGKKLDDALEGTAFNEILIKLGLSSFQKGNEKQGLFEYVFGSAAMLFVPSAMKANSFSTERDLAKMREDRRMGRNSETGNNILNGTIDLSKKNTSELKLLTGMAAKSISTESLMGYLEKFNKFNMETKQIKEKTVEEKQAEDKIENAIKSAVVGELFDRGVLNTSDIRIVTTDKGVITIDCGIFSDKEGEIGKNIGRITIQNSTLANIIFKEAIIYDISKNNAAGVVNTRKIIKELLKETNETVKDTDANGEEITVFKNTIFSKDLAATKDLFTTFVQASAYLYNYCNQNPGAEKELGINKNEELSLALITQINPENGKVMKMLQKGYLEFNGEKIKLDKDFLEVATRTLSEYAELTGQDVFLIKVIAGLQLVASGKGINGIDNNVLEQLINDLSKTQKQTERTNINRMIQDNFAEKDKNGNTVGFKFGISDKTSLDAFINKEKGNHVKLIEYLQSAYEWDSVFVLSRYILDTAMKNGDIVNRAEIMKTFGIDSETGAVIENGKYDKLLRDYIENVMKKEDRTERTNLAKDLPKEKANLFGFFDDGNGNLVNMYMLGKIQLDAALNNFEKNKTTESLEILANASLNYTMGCLFLKGYTMSSSQYTAITEASAAMISGNRGTRKFVPVATGEGKTTIVAALLPVLQAKNSMLGKRTVLLADNGINVQNIFKECMEFYGTINEEGELVNGIFNMQKFDYKGGVKPDKDTVLFMTYSDLAFQYVADKKLGSDSLLKGHMGFLLMDEADMTLYLPKAMISEWSGSETNRKIVKFFDDLVNKNGSKYSAIQDLLNNPNNNKLSFMQRLSLYKDAFTDALRGQGDLITNIKDINSTVKGIQEMGLLKYLVTGGDTSKEATQRWNDYKIIVETAQKLSTLNENTTFSQAEVNKMMLPFESLEAMIADKRKEGYVFDGDKIAELKTKVTDFFTQKEDGSWKLKDDKLKDLLIMQNSLYENMCIRTAVDANPNVMKIAGMMLANNSEFRSDKSLFKYIQDDGGNVYKGYGLETILKNSLTTMLTWKEGIDYGVQDGSVMLIQQGKMQALMPEAGLLQTAEALLRANGNKDIKITRVSPRDSSSAAIIDAVRNAYGAIGLSGTYSKAARSAMGFDELNIGSRFSELNTPNGARDRVIKGTGWVDIDYLNPALNKLCAFNEVIVDMLTVDKGVIVGLPDQTSLDLFTKYVSVLGMDRLTSAQTTYYDSKISAELADANAKGKDLNGNNLPQKFRYHIGIYEQIGRGLNIKMDKGVTSIDAIAIDAHLSYKSAVEQFIGRVLGNRHTNPERVGTGAIAQITNEFGTYDVYENIHIKFISDNTSINAMGRNKEIAQSGYLTSSRTAADYAQLVYSMVVAGGGARAENVEIAKSGAVSKAVNYNAATISTVDQLRTSVASIIMNNSSSPMTDTAACAKAMEIIKPILSDTRYYNGVTLTSEGAQVATQLVQYFTNTSVNTRMNGYSAINKVLQLSGVTVPQSMKNLLLDNTDKTSIPIVTEMDFMAANICELDKLELIKVNPYTENNLGKLISLGMIVDIDKPLSIPYIGKETDAKKIENMTALERLKAVMNSNVGMIPLIANQAIQSQNTPKIVKMFTNYSNIMDRKAELFEMRKDIIESDNSKFMKVINIIPVLASQLQTNISLKLTNRNIEHLKQDVFVDIMENKDQYTNLEQLLINTSYTKNGFSFVPWSMVSVLKNISLANNFGESISWNKAKYSRVINYVNNGNMLGLLEYLSTPQPVRIPVLSSIKDKAQAQQRQQQIEQIMQGKAPRRTIGVSDVVLFPIVLIESAATIFRTPALSLPSDTRAMIPGLKDMKSVSDVINFANTGIPNYYAVGIPTQQELYNLSQQRLRTAFAFLRPDVSADVMMARSQAVMDKFGLGILNFGTIISPITIDMLANGTLFDENNIPNKLFEQEYDKLISGISYGEMLTMKQMGEEYRNVPREMQQLGIKYEKLKSAYKKFEIAVGGSQRAQEILTTDTGKLTEKEKIAYDSYIQTLESLNVPGALSVAQRVAFRETTSGRSMEDKFISDLAERGINYNRVTTNYEQVIKLLRRQGLSEKQAEQLAKDFTLEELSKKDFVSQLQKMIDNKLIKIDEKATRQSIISSIKTITNEQLRKAEVKVADIALVLTMAGLDVEAIQNNEKAIDAWFKEAKVVQEFSDKIDFVYEANMEELSKLTFKEENLDKKTAAQAIREDYEKKTYGKLMEGGEKDKVFRNLSEADRARFFELIGLDYGKIIKAHDELLEFIKTEKVGEIETAIAETLANRAMTIKDFNEEVAKRVDSLLDNLLKNITVEKLSDKDYVEGIKLLLSKGVITVEDIQSGKTFAEIIKSKTIGEIVNALGNDYETKMKAFGLDSVVENVKLLKEKYTSVAERALISDMNITELMNIDSLMNNEKLMKDKLAKFGESLTMNKAKAIAEREGLEVKDIIIGIIGTKAYELYTDRAKELQEEGIDIGNISISFIANTKNIVEEVKGLKALGIGNIEDILKDADKTKNTMRDAIRNKTIAEMEEMTKGMTKEQKKQLYKYVEIDENTIEKKIAEIKKKTTMPIALVEEEIGKVKVSEIWKMKVETIDMNVKARYYGITVKEYLSKSEEEKAKYGADREKIEAKIRELTTIETIDEEILSGYIVGSMSINRLLRETDKTMIDIIYSERSKKYYEMMSAEDFMKATEVRVGSRVSKAKTEEKRRSILGDKYERFMINYNNFSRNARFGEGVKGVSVSVLISDTAYDSIDKVASRTGGKLKPEDAEKVVIVEKAQEVVEEPKATTTTKAVVNNTPSKVVEDCVEVAIETIGNIITLRPLTDAAIKANPYAQDELLAAGVGEGLEGTKLGELRARTGLRYAVVEDIDKVTAPFIAYMETPGSKVGHVVTVTKISNGFVTYRDTDTDEKGIEISIEKFFKEKGFTGLVLAESGKEGLYYVDSQTRNVIEEEYKGLKSKKYEAGKKMLEDIINGVSKPEEIRQAIAAVLAICENADEIAQMLGFDSIREVRDIDTVINGYYEKVGMLLNEEGADKGSIQASIDILSTVRDMLIMVVNDRSTIEMLNKDGVTVEDVMSKLVVSKAVNQNVVVKKMGVAKTKVEKEFVIDVNKLQKAVATKIEFKDKAGIIKDIADMLDLGRGKGRDKMPKVLMKITDIHAIAASA